MCFIMGGSGKYNQIHLLNENAISIWIVRSDIMSVIRNSKCSDSEYWNIVRECYTDSLSAP